MDQESLPPLVVVMPGLYEHYKGGRYQVLDTVIALRDTDASRITLYTLQDEKNDVL